MKNQNIFNKKKVYSYKLPLDAIERLVNSYFQDILDCQEQIIYLGFNDDSQYKYTSYCNNMLYKLQKQLDDKDLPGFKIINDIYVNEFKEKFDKAERFVNNHPNEDLSNKKPCSDPSCCPDEVPF